MLIQLTDIKNDEIKYNHQKDLYLSLNKLYSNPDFIKVFKTYYCNEYVLELVKDLSTYIEGTIEHKEILFELSVISSFQKFLDTIQTNGAMAIHSLNDLNAIPLSEIDDE